MVDSFSFPPFDSPGSTLKQKFKGSFMNYSLEPNQIGRQITQIILTTSEPQAMLWQIAEALGEIFQVDACLIVLGVGVATQPQTILWRAEGGSAIQPQEQTQLLEHPALLEVLAGAQPMAITNLETAETWSAVDWRWGKLPVKSILRIVTRFQGKANGLIVLGRSQAYERVHGEQELLKVAAESVAIAISQIQLQQQVRTGDRYQNLLNHLSLAIRSAMSLEQVLQLAIAGTGEALQSDRALLLLLRYTHPLFQRRSLKNFPKTEVRVACEWESGLGSPAAETTAQKQSLLNHTFWLSESPLCQQALQAAPEPVIIAEGQNLPEFGNSETLAILDSDAMPAMLIVPLLGSHSGGSTQATVLGFIVLQQGQPRLWQPDELELVKWVGNQVSTAIIQSQTLRQVQSLVEERTAQLQRSLEVQAKLYEKTRQQIDQLRHLNELKDEFLATMNHELRTPLAKMKMAIEMLRKPEFSERRDKYLEILEQACAQEIGLITELLALQEIEAQKPQIQVQKVNLKLLINELAPAFEKKWVDKGLTLATDYSARSLILYTDPESLKHILLELLTNAGKYSHPNTTVCLKVEHQVKQQVNQMALSLTNLGSGISPSDITQIFEKFRRGQGVTQQAVQGTGLGLALVKGLVQHLHGTIDVKSEPCEDSTLLWQTCFTLTLPQFKPSEGS
jgi:signal transduction histidine kinase